MTDDGDRRRFEIVRCVGAGGFGEVYEAAMFRPGGVRTTVAVKVLHRGLDPRSQAVQRLRDEAYVLGLLSHPSILRIHDLVLLEDRVALVSEYIAGADLDVCLAGEPRMPLDAILEVVGRIADALYAAKTSVGPDGAPLGILHRDVKPSNVRVGRHGEVKLLDFGIAKAAGSVREAKTQANAIVGSFPYMAPERFDVGEDQSASDVYSLGCVLYEAIAGRRLWGDVSARQITKTMESPEQFAQHVGAGLAKLPDVPPSVLELLAELLAYEAEDRPPLDGLGARCDDIRHTLGGRGLAFWCRRFPWKEPEPVAAELSGRVITESTSGLAGSTITSPPPKQEATQWGLLDEGVTGASVVPELATPEVVRPRRARPAVVIGIAAATIALGGAVALAFVVAVALAYGVGGSDPAAPRPAVGELVVDAAASGASRAPAAEVTPPAEPSRADVAPAEPSPVAPPSEVAAPDTPPVVASVEARVDPAPTSAAVGCSDLVALEPAAILGRLDPGARVCLSAAAHDPGASQTDRAAAARVLIVDAKTRCDRQGDCATYDTEQRYYFDALDRSDADMLYAWASYLSARSTTDDAQLAETLLWIDRALERKDAWTSATYVKRVDSLLGMQARAAYARFRGAPTDERRRLAARDAAVAWVDYRVQIGKDRAEPLALCTSAEGSEAKCLARVHDDVVSVKVTFTSVPAGATVQVDGASIGVTPTAADLDAGAHEVVLTLDDAVSTQKIDVSPDGASRWTWTVDGGGWVSAR